MSVNAIKGASHQPLDTVLSNFNAIHTDSFKSDGDRSKALLGAYALVVKDLLLFENWHERGNAAANSDNLADMVKCEPRLLGQSFKLLNLVFFAILQQIIYYKDSLGNYKPTKFSLSLRQTVFGEWINFLLLQNTRYAKDQEGDMFAYYNENPREGASFNHVMGGVMADQATWLDIIPPERFLDGADPSQPLVVDVGGNIGHDIEKFRQILVLHDWSDEPASKILQALRGALRRGYSKLLIHGHVVPDTMAHPHSTSYDLNMMVPVAGQERTETQWRRLLHPAGYKVVQVWRSPLAAQAVVEAELA
ncbi:S-adenosyl-L-methionine-dependent methyltransferase [Penicillium samsonianum]|uniref:S-adenosyl-L-methionine-dependent methyltransferase n=1 Tax=Penicillium samsonianum TaxID=1882272 RepID=UPI002546BD57|nr:S-adenosyl-L-methionine-dependent methyltransferase [Penicillium samsonianum]KAJ6143600.1 S-adenosyl-L-methionine-dependent methyltransferase [Penicillium samsonianum]